MLYSSCSHHKGKGDATKSLEIKSIVLCGTKDDYVENFSS